MDNALIAFALQVILISLSGVMAPGPITAATLAAGTRSRHAGSLIAIGHGLVELPLMLLVVAGAGTVLASKVVTTGVGLVGGAVLVFMGVALLRGLGKPGARTNRVVVIGAPARAISSTQPASAPAGAKEAEAGAVDLFQVGHDGQLTRMGRARSAPNARTGFLVSERRCVYVAVPPREGHDSEVWEYRLPD